MVKRGRGISVLILSRKEGRFLAGGSTSKFRAPGWRGGRKAGETSGKSRKRLPCLAREGKEERCPSPCRGKRKGRFGILMNIIQKGLKPLQGKSLDGRDGDVEGGGKDGS